MGKFSDWIQSPGTGGPGTRAGIRQLGFAFLSEVEGLAAKALRVDIVQGFSAPEKTQGRANLGVVIGTDVQAFDAGLQSISALAGGANLLPYMTAVDVYATTALTAYARTLLDDANAAGMQATLALVPGTNVQAFDAALQSIAGLTYAADEMIYATAADTFAVTPLTPYARTILDDANAGAVLTTLGVSAYIQTLLDDTNAAAAKTTLGLGNVDNTSDANKPVSTAQQTALDLKAPLASPAFTGNPTVPTQAPGTNNTRAASTAYADAAVAAAGNNTKAWVNFNGIGVIATRGSLNVSSVGDNGAGDYTVNFTTPIVDANYAVSLATRSSAAPSYPTGVVAAIHPTVAPTATALRFVTGSINGSTLSDNDINTVTITR